MFKILISAIVLSLGLNAVDKFEINKDGTLIKRPRIQYNPSKCDQCGDCVNSCPYNMLKTTDNPKLPIAGFCTLCGQCIETCPEKALSYK